MKRKFKPKEKEVVYVERRMPKGWTFIGSNDFSLGQPLMSHEERSAKDHAWMLAIKRAAKEGKFLKEEMARFRQSLKEEAKSNAEVLVEKKYKHDKTSSKMN